MLPPAALVLALNCVEASTSRIVPVPMALATRLMVAPSTSATPSSVVASSVNPVASNVTLPAPAVTEPRLVFTSRSATMLPPAALVLALNCVEAATSTIVVVPTASAEKLTVPALTSATALSVTPSILSAAVTFAVPVPAFTSPKLISPVVTVVRSI